MYIIILLFKAFYSGKVKDYQKQTSIALNAEGQMQKKLLRLTMILAVISSTNVH